MPTYLSNIRVTLTTLTRALLHFVAPKIFNNLDKFEEWFAGVDWKAAKKGMT